MNLDNIWFLLEGCSGKIYDRVYYERNKKTFSRRAPGSYNVIPTKAQAVIREKFRNGNRFAKTAISNQATKAFFAALAKPGQTAYNVALSHYMRTH